MKKLGNFECGIEENFKINFSHVEQELMTKYLNEERFTFLELKAKMVAMLNDKYFPNIIWDSKDDLYSPTPSYSIKCCFYIKLKENLLMIVTSFSAISYLWYKIR